MGLDVLSRQGEAEQEGQGGFKNARKLAAELAAETPQTAKPIVETTPGTIDVSELEDLVGKVRVDAATGVNNRWNDMVQAERRSKQAEEERDAHLAIEQKALLATELLGQLKGGEISATTQQYLADGGTLESLLAELREYEARGGEVTREQIEAVDRELSDARRQLVELSLKRRGILHRQEKDEAKQEAEERYLRAFASKLEQLSSLPKDGGEEAREEALRAGYLPQIIDKMGFDSDKYGLEELAGNQLHVLTDLLCREQLMRQKVTESLSDKGANKVLRFLKTNKIVHGVVAGAVFTASAVSLAHGMPDGAQGATDMVLKGAGFLSAYITSRQLLEGSVDGLHNRSERKRRKEERTQLASDEGLTGLALQTAYNRVEAMPEDRKGTQDAEENLKRLDAIQPDFAELQTAPGGKPYSAEMILDYCSQLYLERKTELDQMAALPDAESRKHAYQELARVILERDVEQMQDKVKASRVQKAVYRSISLISSVVANNIVSNISLSQNAARSVPDFVQTEFRPNQV